MKWSVGEKSIVGCMITVIGLYIAITIKVFMQDQDIESLKIKGMLIVIIALFMVWGMREYRYVKKNKVNLDGEICEYEMEYSEWWRLLFASKKCPVCKMKLKLVKKKTHQGKRKTAYANPDVYRVRIRYWCDNCQREIKLKDLGGK